MMVGVPFQTIEHMAGDLLFLRDFGADMVGCVCECMRVHMHIHMCGGACVGVYVGITPFLPPSNSLGPYVLQRETPIGQAWLAERQHFTPRDFEKESEELFDRTTRMYALARVMLGDANIAATTALQVFNCAHGRRRFARNCMLVGVGGCCRCSLFGQTGLHGGRTMKFLPC